MAELSDHYRLIAPDLRGFGASGRAASGYDAGTLAEDAAALLTALGVSSAAVVGIDAGTAPAFLLAHRPPDGADDGTPSTGPAPCSRCCGRSWPVRTREQRVHPGPDPTGGNDASYSIPPISRIVTCATPYPAKDHISAPL